MRNHKEFKKMISVFSKNLAKEIKIFPLFGFLKRFVINILLNYFYLLFKNREREYKKILSKDGLKRFKQYITSSLKRQLREYLKDKLPPSQISYFFGHTHKPFSKIIEVDLFPNQRNLWSIIVEGR